jgi:tyrosyl-tRNA synthetase
VVLTMPLLEGLDGVNKMSKSLGNYVGITEPPQEMFGKLMSVSDELMWRYLELLSFRPLAALRQLRREAEEGRNPRDIKFLLARELVGRFHGDVAAERAEEHFVSVHRDKGVPEDLPVRELPAAGGELGIGYVLKGVGLVASTSEAFRLIGQGAVRLDGERVAERNLLIKAGEDHVYQVGKRRFAKIRLVEPDDFQGE